jgi:transposase
MEITTIGLDLAKSVFQVHGIGADGTIVVRKQIRRRHVLAFFKKLPPCLVGMEACGSAHYWAREIMALGHRVKLMPPSYVKPYVKRSKSDAADAAAICEAVARPTMRFVPVKSAEQQSVLLLHRTRSLLMRQRTMTVNALRAHLAEFGIVAARGRKALAELIAKLFHDGDVTEADGLPALAHRTLEPLARQVAEIDQKISQLEKGLRAWHRENEDSQRLETIPSIGFLTATALAATVTDPSLFKSGRQFAAWLGVTPQENSTGGKQRLGRISKQGDRYLRTLLVVGATSMIHSARKKGPDGAPWINGLLARRPARLVSVALANKTARIAWAVLARKQDYRAPAIAGETAPAQ